MTAGARSIGHELGTGEVTVSILALNRMEALFPRISTTVGAHRVALAESFMEERRAGRWNTSRLWPAIEVLITSGLPSPAPKPPSPASNRSNAPAPDKGTPPDSLCNRNEQAGHHHTQIARLAVVDRH